MSATRLFPAVIPKDHSVGALVVGVKPAVAQFTAAAPEAIEVAGGTPLISRLGADGVRILP